MNGAGRQALVLLLLGGLIGFAANAAREKPLPLRGSIEPPPPAEPGSDLPVTSPAEAVVAWESGAFFLDIREPFDWEERRVSGSFSVAAGDFQNRYFAVVVEFGTDVPLVLYGAAPDSFAVRHTAAELLELGHEDVRIVTDGLDALLAAGIDESSGPEGM